MLDVAIVLWLFFRANDWSEFLEIGKKLMRPPADLGGGGGGRWERQKN